MRNIAWRVLAWTAGVLILALVISTAWRQRSAAVSFEAEAAQARQLALTYEAVQLAPKSFWQKPVLWRLGCRSYRDTTCYYEGNLAQPVVFPDGTQLPYDGHKGMSFCRALARIQKVEPQRVYLELLQARGTRE